MLLTYYKYSVLGSYFGITSLWLNAWEMSSKILCRHKLHMKMLSSKPFFLRTELKFLPQGKETNLLGLVYTTVEKASGRSRMLGQDMVIWGKWWMCRRRIKGNKIFLLSWGSPASWGRTRNSSSGEAQLQKVPPRRRPCHFIIHEKSSPPLFSSPNVNTHRSRVAFLTNHNWETPFFHDRWTPPP
jgi:hypothetical protein